jgi:hypothetical protein
MFMVVIPLFKVLGSHNMSEGIRQCIGKGLLSSLDKGHMG